MTISQKIWSAAGVLFLAALCVITVYAWQKQRRSLPVVTIAAPQNTEEGCLVPKESIFLDSREREYVVLIKERDGPWGGEYYGAVRYVSSKPYSESLSVLQGAGGLSDPVAVTCSRPLEDGDAVRLRSADGGRGAGDETAE